MNTVEFLARVVPTDGYICVANTYTKDGATKVWQQFFPPGGYREAASYLAYRAQSGCDTYFAVASYMMATLEMMKNGRTRYVGGRHQANTRSIRAMFIDLDVKRDGDNKKAGSVFATVADAMIWLGGFQAKVGLPQPNLYVSSGYGLHVYWVMDTPMPSRDWQPYGLALKAALQANGFTGDHGLVSDSARILRPPGTANMKSGTAAMVEVVDSLTLPDYPNAQVLKPLEPFLGVVAAKPATVASTGGTVSSLRAGGPNPMLQGGPNLAAAAQANISTARRPHLMEHIAASCGQVQASLATGGDGDPYPFWYRGLLSLAHFCDDGADFIHPLSSGDPRYDAAAVDAAAQRIASEAAAKPSLGAPSCQSLDAESPHAGVCQACPHFGKITSPLSLGVAPAMTAATVADMLPPNYFNETIGLTRSIPGDKGSVTVLVPGTVHNPRHATTHGAWTLEFTYSHAGIDKPIVVTGDTPLDGMGTRKYFGAQHLFLAPSVAQQFGEFIMAWVNNLRANRMEKSKRSNIEAFGWALDDNGDHAGLAIAGTLYKPDGTIASVPTGDPEVSNYYTPRGTLDGWKRAYAYVTKDKHPDLDTIIAASFGAVLMRLSGHSGAALSVWSTESAVGKTSAMRVAQAVWGAAKAINSTNDTQNAIRAKVALARIMPSLWDEVRVKADRTEEVVQLFFDLTQGKDKARLHSDANLKPIREWETILILAGNAQLMEHVLAHAGGDPGMVRLLEYQITRKSEPLVPAAAQTVALTADHYGRAGEVYATWLSANRDAAAKAVTACANRIAAETGANGVERFHVTTMACILVGAMIANKLELTTFNIPVLREFIYKVFLDARTTRADDRATVAQADTPAMSLAAFVAAHDGGRLVTDTFVSPLPGRPLNVIVIDKPRGNSQPVSIHVSVADMEMRINRGTLREWCYKAKVPYRTLVSVMETQWGATKGRASLGGGTPYTTGQVPTISVPLTHPETRDYMAGHTVKTAPAPATVAATMQGPPPP